MVVVCVGVLIEIWILAIPICTSRTYESRIFTSKATTDRYSQRKPNTQENTDHLDTTQRSRIWVWLAIFWSSQGGLKAAASSGCHHLSRKKKRKEKKTGFCQVLQHNQFPLEESQKDSSEVAKKQGFIR